MKKSIVASFVVILSIIMAGCTATQERANTGGNSTVENQTANNKELVVEWAPLYTKSEKPMIDIYNINYQDLLYDTKVLMFSDLSTDGKVTLTTNGGGYLNIGDPMSSFNLLTLLTNRTDKKITNIHYEIRVILNSTGEILGESGFDIPENIYGKYIEPNTGYVAFIPFDDQPKKDAGTFYSRDEITVYQEITYDTVIE
ncbi:hypothetical protein HB943_12950 [Listeria weihenstephanensis]|uniref:Lipoprotein n=1 Tax=Listeria weihenstephanensis TaxID=1006155 RepID=A0A841Z8J5_9LIST|nr:hypothetical protein [Listeria weihenstephanensis]MBC1501514.1 hypothetical protein [Listeria weihenstephanensis]